MNSAHFPAAARRRALAEDRLDRSLLRPSFSLDLSAHRVNPEDLTGGTPPVSTSRTDPTLEPPRVTSTAGLEHLFAGITPGPASPVQPAVAQAVVYLRVSTLRQLHTASDIDEDGNSNATQRVETSRKVKELRAIVVRAFVEPGQSAQTISKRTEFKKLLRYLDDHPEVRFVVI